MRLSLLLAVTASICALGAASSVEDYIFEKLAEHSRQRQTNTKSWMSCVLCKATISTIREFFSGGRSEAELVNVLITGCVQLGIETKSVCNGVIPRFKGMLFQVVTESQLWPHDMCSIAFDGVCGPVSESFDWNVTVNNDQKPPVKQIPLPSPNAPKLQIAHLADTHEDPDYSPGSRVDCADPLCCRKRSTPKYGGRPDLAGYWGTHERCDIPERTLQASLNFMAESVKPDVIYYTGDIMPHNVWESSREENLRQFNRTVELLRGKFPNIKVIPVMGNHEGVPVNSFAIPEITNENSISWLYNALADAWSSYIPEERLGTFRKGGYFSYDIYPRLRIISLNTNYCNNLNWWLMINGQDPTGQLAWLVDELDECEKQNIKVHIMGHIPPGISDCLPVWSRNYNNILNRYESTIAAQFYGHTHHEEFTVFFDKKNTTRAFGVGLIAPSLTTFEAGDPAIRIYSVDGEYCNSTYQVLDYETYFMNLAEANSNPSKNHVPEWDRIPSMKEVFGMSSMRPQEWAEYAARLRSDDDAFRDFYALYMKRLTGATYDAKMKRNILCRLVTSRSGTPCPF